MLFSVQRKKALQTELELRVKPLKEDGREGGDEICSLVQREENTTALYRGKPKLSVHMNSCANPCRPHVFHHPWPQ